MKRIDIINFIGREFLKTNIENGEFSYASALKGVGKNIKDYQSDFDGRKPTFLDLRFSNERLSVLIECKDRFSNWNMEEIMNQLGMYVRLEKQLTENRIVAILAETEGDGVYVWYGQSVIIDEAHRQKTENKLKSFAEYENICFGYVNNKLKVVNSISDLNKMLNADGIDEKLRSQFVGTCLLALKNGLVYNGLKPSIDANGKKISETAILIDSIKRILTGLLSKNEDLNKASKLSLLNNKVLNDQDVRTLKYDDFKKILQYIDDNVIPYINDSSTAGQDLLNLFFTTFNKYVGKSDKNQAFTPDHICEFMSRAVGVNKKSRVLDPCCGSGAFLVRAMVDAMDDCDSEDERDNVKTDQIYGIEYEDGAYGLASTNMLIHGDGNSNVIQASMFEKSKWIKDQNINIVLMNPPYNATKKQCLPSYVDSWTAKQKESGKDPSKGFHYVEWIARHISPNSKIAVLLPVQCAIANKGAIYDFKEKMLNNYTLDAVFSLPNEVFYPGASAVACCMIFDLSQRHSVANKDTFFGYYRDDQFVKRKGLGRVEKVDENGNSMWLKTEEIWLDLYRNRKTYPGLSVTHKVTAKDEWLAEAYMETDYTKLTENDFQVNINNYLAHQIKEGNIYED